MLFILGISISVFLGFLLLIKKEKSRADKVLAIWLFLLFIHQLFHYLLYSEEIFQYPYLLGAEFPMPLLHGVLLYFYVLEITGKKLNNIWTVLPHFIPAVSLILLAIPFYSLSGEEKIWVFKHDGEGFEWYVIYQNVLVVISGLFYTYLSLNRIKKHRINILYNFSNTDKIELQWLQYLTVGLGVIWLVTIFFDSSIIFSFVVVFVLFIGFFGINQLNIFNTNQVTENGEDEIELSVEIDKEELSLNPTSKRYAKSGLNEETAVQIYNRLNQQMLDEVLYKNNDLTLVDLASHLDVHPNHLSQVINEKEQKNFYNYINSLRIQEFIRLVSLPESKKFTLLSLAYECGFNSKSTFNKHFKENTGKTPSEYFKSQNAEY